MKAGVSKDSKSKPVLETTPERSALMAKVRQSGTKPEITVRKLIHAAGFRFRVKAKDLPETPDIVNRSARWAIFVHGCFWHAHEGCRWWKIPQKNSEFWKRKFTANRARDERNVRKIAEIVACYRVAQVRSVAWAINDLEQENETPFHSKANISAVNEERIRYLFDNDEYDLPNNLRPVCHQDGNHSYNAIYGRLRYDQPAQTITTGFPSPGQGRYIHPSRQRTLTPHEAARLQFFPDFFDFTAAPSRTALKVMIGNAVSVKLSYILALELFAP